jgi:hypothetical protein
VPRDTLFGAAEVSRAIDWSIGSPRIDAVAMLKGLRFSTRETGRSPHSSEPRTAQSERTRQQYVDGRPRLDADGVISSPENRCFRGFARFGHRRRSDVREGPCRIGEPWPAKVVARGQSL